MLTEEQGNEVKNAIFVRGRTFSEIMKVIDSLVVKQEPEVLAENLRKGDYFYSPCSSDVHFPGEICTLPVHENLQKMAEDNLFVYDHRVKEYTLGDITNNNTDDLIYKVNGYGQCGDSAWILRPIPKYEAGKSLDKEWEHVGVWRRPVGTDEGFLTHSGMVSIITKNIPFIIEFNVELNIDYGNRWILRRKKTQWVVGDWVYCDHQKVHGIFKVFYIGTEDAKCEPLAKGPQSLIIVPKVALRPLTSADWVVEIIRGVKVRAYEDHRGNILWASKGYLSSVLPAGHNDFMIASREICKRSGVPICPFEVSRGNFEYPE
ncbi:MAG: hypothetical protein ABFC94_15665 [Syntrophomonas sp.]